jgi:dTDP-4-dehydrorhamnose reductase
MRRLLVLGAKGQVGRALAACARQADSPHVALGRAECDITDPRAVERAIRYSRTVINCAAYTSADRAETEVEAAHSVNGVGAENVAKACAAAAIPLVHLSTEHVFDGASPRAAREDDPTGPLMSTVAAGSAARSGCGLVCSPTLFCERVGYFPPMGTISPRP